MPKTGKVRKSTGKWYTVELPDGTVVNCRIRGRLRLEGLKTTNPIAVGDTVILENDRDEEGKMVISDFETRTNYIVRKSTNLSKQMQILAANVDRAYLIVTLRSPVTQLAFIDRFLVAAESFRIPVTILFNKVDLYNEKELEEIVLAGGGIGFQRKCVQLVSWDRLKPAFLETSHVPDGVPSANLRPVLGCEQMSSH